MEQIFGSVFPNNMFYKSKSSHHAKTVQFVLNKLVLKINKSFHAAHIAELLPKELNGECTSNQLLKIFPQTTERQHKLLRKNLS